MRKSFAVVLFVAFAIPLFASDELATVDRSFGERLRGAGDRVQLQHLVLPGLESPVNVNLERFEVWAPDAKIVAFGEHGSRQMLPRPATRYYRGTIEGQPDSLFFAAVEPDGAIYAAASAGTKRITIATGKRMHARGEREVAEPGEEAPIFARETDAVDDLIDNVKGWSCAAEGSTFNSIAQAEATTAAEARARIEQSGNPGPSANVSYNFRIAVETDFELYNAFGSTNALTTYIGNLVGASSTIYQRDVKATLTLGTLHVWTTSSDPWAVAPPNTSSALNEFATYWHNNYPTTSDQHAAVVMVSGKNFSGGVAWLNRLSSPTSSDTVCANGSCGPGNDGLVIGPYAFCGNISVITTTVPDPNATVAGHQYGMPFNNNFWILSEFAHELGHVCSAPHTHCVTLTAAEKQQYSTTRNYVDECYAGEGGCFSSTISNYLGACYTNQLGQPTYYCPAPVEWGTIMSYCHNTTDPNFPNNIPSRYTFGRASEPSFKMLNYFSTRFESVTPNVIITTNSAPLACGAQNASVPSTAGATYQWQITGGTINGSSTSNAVNFTPNAASVTLTVTATNAPIGATITNSVTVATSCGGACQQAPQITAQPANTTITQGQSAQLSVTATGATSYAWYQLTNAGSVAVGTTSTISVSPTSTSQYFVWTSNACGATASSAATVTVNVACTPPSINTQPANTSITQGQSAQLSVVAGGTGPFTYAWYQITNAGSVAAGTTSAISVSPTSTSQYFVWVYNACGSAISGAATVTVNAACTPVSYAAQPQNTTITQGQNAQLSVVANGTGPFTYAWYQLTNAGTIAVGTNSSVLVVSPSQTSQYFVWTFNSCGQMASNLATVTVNPVCNTPSITSQPANTTINNGQTAQLSVTASGGAPYTYAWYQLTNSGSVLVGTSSTLSVSPNATSQYFVWVYNGCGAAVSSVATVTVH